MINLTLLREDPERVAALLAKKDPAYDSQRLIALDADVRKIRTEVEELRHEKNELARQARGGISPEIRERSIACGETLKKREAELVVLEAEFKEHYLWCPNLLHEEVPEGDAAANVVIKKHGEQPVFNFEPQNHVVLGEKLGWLNFKVAAQMAGNNFAFYAKDGVNLLYALSRYMLKHNRANGYEPVLPPVLVNEQSLVTASNLPRFRDQVYAVEDSDYFLTPTAEVNLTNCFRGQILDAHDLPVRMTAWTSCFRREAGGYGAHERGLIRIHQFEKVELYTVAHPDKSSEELERMLECAESILVELGLHYRVSLLAAQDCSFPSAKTYDIEVWLPGQKEYYEVASVSNCTDFQARRGHIRYRDKQGEKPHLVHTLNGSSLALPRLMVAIMETYQQKDGTIVWPDVLKSDALW